MTLRAEVLKAEVGALIEGAIADRVFPGGVLAVVSGSDRVCLPFGRETYEVGAPSISTDSIFDLASLTKVIATATALMQCLERGQLALDEPIERIVPELAPVSMNQIKIRHLMSHMAGVAGVTPFYRTCRTRDELLAEAFKWKVAYHPGTRRVYDDVSYIILGMVVERVSGKAFDRYCAEQIFGPLGMTETMFCPSPRLSARLVPTEVDPVRGGLLRGLVHDENACLMGGVAGHAGLFATAGDVAKFCAALIADGADRSHRIVSDASVRRFRELQWEDEDGQYGLGWDRFRRSYMGDIGDAEAIGHTGFTGTSIVISPTYGFAVVLLTNRVHPQRSDRAGIDAVRRAVAGIVARHILRT
jgi:CubicO group peptidase (beta-lactamase class C family)